MDGATRAAGAVAGITQTRSPVALARRVMAASPSCPAERHRRRAIRPRPGLEVAPEGWFETPERRRQLDEMLSRNADAFDVDMKYGTVGAVARDAAGHVAAAPRPAA